MSVNLKSGIGLNAIESYEGSETIEVVGFMALEERAQQTDH